GVRTLFGHSNYMQPSRFLANIPADVSEKFGSSAHGSNAHGSSSYGGSFGHGAYSGYGTYGATSRGNNASRSRSFSGSPSGYRKPKTWDDFDQSPPVYDEPQASERTIDFEAFDDISGEAAATSAH